MSVRKLGVLLAAMALALAACGGDSGDPASGELVNPPSTSEAVDDGEQSSDEPEPNPAPTSTTAPEEPIGVGDDEIIGTPATTTTELPSITGAGSTSGDNSASADTLDGTLSLPLARLATEGAVSVLQSEQECIADELASSDLTFGADFGTLPLDQQAVGVEAVFDCAPTAARTFLEEESEARGSGSESISCTLTEFELDDDTQPNEILAILHLAEGLPTPDTAIADATSYLVNCFRLGELFQTFFGLDPVLDNVVDQTCLSIAFAADVPAELFTALLSDPSGFDSDAPPSEFRSIFDCVDFGELFVEQLAPISLSDSEIDCVDGIFREESVIAAMLADETPPATFERGLADCLSPESLQALDGN